MIGFRWELWRFAWTWAGDLAFSITYPGPPARSYRRLAFGLYVRTSR